MMMTAIERKQHSEQRLLALGIAIYPELPPIEEEDVVVLKTAQEIAERILVLTYLSCIPGNNALSPEIVSFLKQEGLWTKVSEEEKKLFEKENISEDESSVILWRAESIWLLLWTIEKVTDLGLPNQEVDPRDMFTFLPEFMTDTSDFIRSAKLRSKFEILNESDLTFRLNWAIRQSSIDGSPDLQLNESIAYERFFALGWVTALRPAWDEG